MHPIVCYITIFLAIGAVGMGIANRKATPQTRRQRWKKYFTYIIFTGTVVISIFYNFFYWLALLISAVSMIELAKINFLRPAKPAIISLLIFLVIAAGFIQFAVSFENSFSLFIYFQVLVFDGFCQITGQLFGRRPLVPAISPTKTWEGLAGGWVCCIIAAMLAANWVFIPVSMALLFGLFTGFTSFIGDLLASWYKRKAGVKDYSNWLPGQGGFLDRFDSLLCTAAIYYLIYITIFKYGFDSFIKA